MILARSGPQVCVTVVDRCQAFGRGVAYSAPGLHHRINVPAGKMGGLDPTDGEGFERWLDAQHRPRPDFAASFVPRAWFGDYLWAQLEAARAHGALTLCVGEVRALQRLPDGWLCSGEGLSLQADQVVLCTGNTSPSSTAPQAAGGRFIPDVWAPGALAPIGPQDSVLVQGTGATAIDALLELRERGHQGHITMVSRRGLLPKVDMPMLADYPDFFDASAPTLRLGAVMSALRHEVRHAATQGLPWQQVVDAFRVHASRIWLALDTRDRHRFLRHVRAYWMVHRHRLAPDIDARLARMSARGELELVAARILRTSTASDHVAVDLRPRGADEVTRTLRADWLLNCIGPSENFSRLDDPLWSQLLAQGIARPGPLDMGVDVDTDLRLIARDGRAHADLSALGLPTRGCFWEVTAVVHIRQQAQALARRLLTSHLRESEAI